MDIDASVIDQVGETIYARWKAAALADLANIICQKDLFPITDDYVGIVVGEGRHIALLAWYSDVTNVQTTDGVKLAFHVSYDMGDGWTPETKYANCLTIAERLNVGTAITPHYLQYWRLSSRQTRTFLTRPTASHRRASRM